MNKQKDMRRKFPKITKRKKRKVSRKGDKNKIQLPAIKEFKQCLQQVKCPALRDEMQRKLQSIEDNLRTLHFEKKNFYQALEYSNTPRTIKSIKLDGTEAFSTADNEESYIIIFFDMVSYTEIFNRKNECSVEKTKQIFDFYEDINKLCKKMNMKLKSKYLQHKEIRIKELSELDHCRMVKTNGDSMMIGIRVPLPHLLKKRLYDACILCADAFKKSKNIKLGSDRNIKFRCGMAYGMVTASSALGKHDLHGASANLASRLEQSGEADAIHMPDNLAEQLNFDQECFVKQSIKIKGFDQTQQTCLINYKYIIHHQAIRGKHNYKPLEDKVMTPSEDKKKNHGTFFIQNSGSSLSLPIMGMQSRNKQPINL